jgi:Tfp pilus assembly protein PilF
LARAIRIDPGFADAIYNLASLEFDSGDFAEARQWWQRYLEFDTTSEWAKRARQGVRYVELELRQQTAG